MIPVFPGILRYYYILPDILSYILERVYVYSKELKKQKTIGLLELNDICWSPCYHVVSFFEHLHAIKCINNGKKQLPPPPSTLLFCVCVCLDVPDSCGELHL